MIRHRLTLPFHNAYNKTRGRSVFTLNSFFEDFPPANPPTTPTAPAIKEGNKTRNKMTAAAIFKINKTYGCRVVCALKSERDFFKDKKFI